MPKLSPISRHKLIKRLRTLGFNGPYSGGNHQFMLKGTIRLIVPNPHREDISADLQIRLIRQAGYYPQAMGKRQIKRAIITKVGDA